MISAAFKIEIPENYTLQQTGPHISFARKIYSKPEEIDNDCSFGVQLLEYNNFSFGNKEKMNFKIQVVFEAGPDSRFKKLASRLEIGKSVFITGFLDLDDVEIPFVEAKEIDLLDDVVNNPNLQSPFSRTHKFKNNKNIFIKKEKTLDNNIIDVFNTEMDDQIQINDINDDNNNDKEEEIKRNRQSLRGKQNRGRKRKTNPVQHLKNIENSGVDEQEDNKNDKSEEELFETNTKNCSEKRKKELMDLSIQRLKKTRNNTDEEKDDDEIIKNEEESLMDNQIVDNRKKESSAIQYLKKGTKVSTRSQKQKNKELNQDNITFIE